MKTYKIQIGENQRAFIERAMAVFNQNELSTVAGTGQIDGESERGEFQMLLGMIRALPKDDEQCPPGTLHGFTL